MYENEAISLGLQISEMQMYFGNGSAVCYAGKKNHLIIDSNLDVKKCTVALDDPINLVGKIDRNGIFLKNNNWKLWVKDELYQNDKCKTCFFISQCQSNNCRLKNIKQSMSVCPTEIIDNEINISNEIINYIKKHEELE